MEEYFIVAVIGETMDVKNTRKERKFQQENRHVVVIEGEQKPGYKESSTKG